MLVFKNIIEAMIVVMHVYSESTCIAEGRIRALLCVHVSERGTTLIATEMIIKWLPMAIKQTCMHIIWHNIIGFDKLIVAQQN